MSIVIPKYDDRGNRSGTSTLDVDWMSVASLPKEAIDFAEIFGRHLTAPFYNEKYKKIEVGRDGLTTTQLRNFFGELRRIQSLGFEGNETDFYMLKPKLAYAKARALKNNRISDFEAVIRLLVDKVAETNEPYRFINFAKFVEATVAFHKYYGGN